MIICCAGIAPNLCRFCSKFVLRQFFCDAFISMSIFDKFLAVKMNKKQDWKKNNWVIKVMKTYKMIVFNEVINLFESNVCKKIYVFLVQLNSEIIKSKWNTCTILTHLQIDFHHQFFIVCDSVCLSLCVLCLSLININLG